MAGIQAVHLVGSPEAEILAAHLEGILEVGSRAACQVGTGSSAVVRAGTVAYRFRVEEVGSQAVQRAVRVGRRGAAAVVEEAWRQTEGAARVARDPCPAVRLGMVAEGRVEKETRLWAEVG